MFEKAKIFFGQRYGYEVGCFWFNQQE